MEQQEVTDQSDVFAFLGDPTTHYLHEPVKRIDTRGSAVFLAGDDAYKIKRAARPNFSTLEMRRLACEREIAVNRAYVSSLYLGAVPIAKDRSGLRFGGGGTIVEWTVHMRRFDENRTLDYLSERNELNFDIITELANVVVAMHGRAPVAAQKTSIAALQRQIDRTLATFEAAPGDFTAQAVAGLRRAMQQSFSRLELLLAEREMHGQVRRCHGDLHLGNIAFIEDQLVLFDAKATPARDVLYDFAFLLMDMWTRGLRRHANLLFNRYLQVCLDVERQLEGLALLPLFLSLCAAIRAEVIFLSAGRQVQQISAAHRYFEAACEFIATHRLDLIAIGGLTGAGNSSFATEPLAGCSQRYMKG